MKHYTHADYLAGLPCYHCWSEVVTEVKVLSIDHPHPFDNSRRVAYQYPNGYVAFANIEGSDLTTTLYTQ